jgi:hypothetical protein
MKSLRVSKVVFLFAILILVVGCELKWDEPEVGEGAWPEEFIATMNIDGSDVQLIQSQNQTSFAGARPYFVRDLAGNYDDEVILLDFKNRIEIMSLNGEYRRTIIDSLGGVKYFNQDRTKMIVNHDQKVYFCSVDGSEVKKVSLDYVSSRYPSFSFDENSILYSYSISYESTLLETGIMEYVIATNESKKLVRAPVQRDYQYETFYSIAKISDEAIVYSYGVNNYSDIDSIHVLTNIMNDYRMHNLSTGEIETIWEQSRYMKYSHLKEFAYFSYDWLLNLATLSSLQVESSVYSADDASFSSNDRYLMLNEIIYDIRADTTSCVEDGDFFGKYHHVSKTHLNLGNTKLVGIVRYLHYIPVD